MKNINLPLVSHSTDFYIWFNAESKEEYYSTPMYFYKCSFELNDTNTIRSIYWIENDKEQVGRLHPRFSILPI